jgi:hypothetical protein
MSGISHPAHFYVILSYDNIKLLGEMVKYNESTNYF